MRKLLALFLILSIAAGCFGGCDGSPEATQGTAPEKKGMLPQSIDLVIDGQTVPAVFQWTDTTCTWKIQDKLEMSFVFDGNNSLRMYMGDDEYQNSEYFTFVFDENGYIVTTNFTGGEVFGTLTYSTDYSSFVWDLQEEGTVQGTASESGVIFDVQNEGDIRYSFRYDDSYSFTMEGNGMSIQYSSQLDSDGSLSMITRHSSQQGSEALGMAVTSSDRAFAHNWQMVPLIALLQYYSGYPAVIWAMSSISACYAVSDR